MIIPLENQPSMICLGPMGSLDPTSIINLETSRIPIKSSDMNLIGLKPSDLGQASPLDGGIGFAGRPMFKEPFGNNTISANA